MSPMEKYLSINGVEIFIKQMGQGEPLLFLHGGPGAEHRTFLPHVEPLAESYSLIFYDQPGCGRSGKADRYSFEQEIDTLEKLRQALNIDKLNLIGESWGTMLALLYATSYPEHVGKMVLASAIGASVEGYLRFGEELRKRMTPEDTAQMRLIEERLLRGETQVQELFDILDPYYVHSRETLQRKLQISDSQDAHEMLSNEITLNYNLIDKMHLLSHIPILVLQGESDMITPPLIRELLIQYIPHAELVPVEQCGHWIFLEQPGLFMQHVSAFFGHHDFRKL